MGIVNELGLDFVIQLLFINLLEALKNFLVAQPQRLREEGIGTRKLNRM